MLFMFVSSVTHGIQGVPCHLTRGGTPYYPEQCFLKTPRFILLMKNPNCPKSDFGSVCHSTVLLPVLSSSFPDNKDKDVDAIQIVIRVNSITESFEWKLSLEIKVTAASLSLAVVGRRVVWGFSFAAASGHRFPLKTRQRRRYFLQNKICCSGLKE
ncbi:hypothetical protein J6590_038560 [Homalodisca vitripennis]|nr:hypothetical protein J6590_038560 [Homalodisca vitripennis]